MGVSLRETNMISDSRNATVCMWDRHPFVGKAVRCPVYSKPQQVTEKKREFYINRNMMDVPRLEGVDVSPKETFYDGNFCSPNCCLAWIEERSADPRYAASRQLFEAEHGEVVPANDREVLTAFGGWLSIKEFRKFNRNYTAVERRYSGDHVVIEYEDIYL